MTFALRQVHFTIQYTITSRIIILTPTLKIEKVIDSNSYESYFLFHFSLIYFIVHLLPETSKHDKKVRMTFFSFD